MVQTASLHGARCVRVGVWQCSPTLKGRVVCGTVYGDMHLKDLLGSFVRVGYRIPVPDFYLVLHGLRCRKSTIMDKTKLNQTITGNRIHYINISNLTETLTNWIYDYFTGYLGYRHIGVE